jgi:peptidyl-prolyl cis-trans isomerase B (cyclophilin B)
MGKGAIAEHAIGPFFCANLENFAYYGCRVSHTQLADRATGNLMHNSWRNWILTIVATIFVAATAGCNNSSTASNASPAPSPVATIAASPTGSGDDLATKFPGAPILKGKATVLMMVKGEAITLELDGDNAPVTAGNFADLISKNVYDGLIFHRVVRQPSPFVAQGGDPKSKDPNVPIEQLGQSGYLDASGQERRIPLEIKPASSAKTIYGMTFEQASLSDKPKLTHKRGALAMARSADPNSASSQFYITLADVSFLDGNYAVFGYVTQGMDVVDKIQQGDRIDSVKITQGAENLKAGK